MKDRCYNKASKAFKNYGGRGIIICPAWRHSFERFWEDMGPSYEAHLTIERIDNNGNYEPENCKWIERVDQASNRRNNVFVYLDGKRMTCTQAERRLGIPRYLSRRVYETGCSHQEALEYIIQLRGLRPG